MTVAVVTSIYGGYDTLAPLPTGHGFDAAVCVTDDLQAADGWDVIHAPSGLPPRAAAKAAKCLPWEFVDADCSVWVDGSLRLTRPGLRHQAETLLATADLVVMRHPDQSWRPDPYAEAAFSASMPKYAGQPLAEQVAHYREQGMPERVGLWALCMVARRHTVEQMDLGADWLTEIMRWTVQDQVSLPYLCWRAGITPAVWDVPLLHNGWWDYRNHRDHS